MNQAISGRSIVILGDGSQTRDFVYIGDGVEALVHAGLAEDVNRSVLNIGSGIEVSITELAHMVRQVTGKWVDCLCHGEKEAGVSRLVADLALSREKLGYQPKTTLSEGLRLTIMRAPRFSGMWPLLLAQVCGRQSPPRKTHHREDSRETIVASQPLAVPAWFRDLAAGAPLR